MMDYYPRVSADMFIGRKICSNRFGTLASGVAVTISCAAIEKRFSTL